MYFVSVAVLALLLFRRLRLCAGACWLFCRCFAVALAVRWLLLSCFVLGFKSSSLCCSRFLVLYYEYSILFHLFCLVFSWGWCCCFAGCCWVIGSAALLAAALSFLVTMSAFLIRVREEGSNSIATCFYVWGVGFGHHRLYQREGSCSVGAAVQSSLGQHPASRIGPHL